jgi:hypothetical protein
MDNPSGPSLRSSGAKTPGTSMKRRKRRRTVSLGSTSAKPTLTERQQLQLAMQLSSPVSSPASCHEEKVIERSKLSKRNDRGWHFLYVCIVYIRTYVLMYCMYAAQCYLLGETLLHNACIKGDYSAVVSLVESGADIHATDNASKLSVQPT